MGSGVAAYSKASDVSIWWDNEYGRPASSVLLGVQEVPGSNPGGPTKFLMSIPDT